MKRCTKCGGDPKPLSEFYKDKSKKDGVSSWCKICLRVKSRKYHIANRDKIHERNRERYTANPEKAIARTRKYHAENPDKVSESNRRRYAANRDKIIERARKYYANNREKVIESQKKYNAAHREQKCEYLKEYYATNRDRLREYSREYGRVYRVAHPEVARESYRNRRARILGNGGTFTEREWRKLKDFYGSACLRCSRREPDVELVRDHVIPLIHGGPNVIENIQCLCRSCNAGKHDNYIDYRPIVFRS